VKVPTNSTYHYHYAMALSQKGDKPGAAKELKAAMQSNPKQEDVDRIKDLMKKVS
jgi:hypothetical protein